jgi:hypothetical protein
MQWAQAQVVEPSVLGARLVIVDCPSSAYLPALLSATALHCRAQHAQHGPASNGADVSGGGSSDSGRDVYVIHLADAEASIFAFIAGQSLLPLELPMVLSSSSEYRMASRAGASYHAGALAL